MLLIIGLLLFLIVMLFTLRIALGKSGPVEDDNHNPLIHASGIYSILRRSPREEITKVKPAKEEFLKYCSSLNENRVMKVGQVDCNQYIQQWNASFDQSVEAIEKGDKEGVEFYYYDFKDENCPICSKFFKKGRFVTREEIYKYPSIVPPLHIGCNCTLHAHHGKENLRDTTELGMSPLFNKGLPPELPNWKAIAKPQTIRGSQE